METIGVKNRVKQKLSSFFRQTKGIGGLAIAEKSLNLAFYDKNSKLVNKEIVLDSAEPSTILKTLIQLKKEIKPFPSLIVSLRPHSAFLQIFEFPMAANSEQIHEAMNLANSALPLNEDEIYTDWMFVESKVVKKKETVLGMMNKNQVNSVLKIFEDSGISAIAMETYSWSLGRFLEEGDEITLIILEFSDAVVFIIYDGQTPYFQFDLPKEILEQGEKHERIGYFAKRLIHFILSEDHQTRKVKTAIVLGSGELKDYLSKNIIDVEFKNILVDEISDFNQLAALGAAKRGLIARRMDAIVSFLPIGTELAYVRHRLVSFIDFSQKFLIGFGGFLIVLFLATAIMAQTRISSVKSQLEKEIVLPVEAVQAKEKAAFFNDLVLKAEKIYAAIPLWEKLFTEIDNYAGIGVNISAISSDSIGSAIQFSGVAASRDALVVLKNKLANSSVFEAEPFSLSLFLNQENVPFTVRAKLKDPGFLYSD